MDCVDLDSNVNSLTIVKQSVESPVKSMLQSRLPENNSQMQHFQPPISSGPMGHSNVYNNLSEAMQKMNSSHMNVYNQALQPNLGYGLDPQSNGYNQIPQLNGFNLNHGYNQQQNFGYNQLNQTEIMRYQQMQQSSNNSYNNTQFPYSTGGMYSFNQNMQQQQQQYNVGNYNQINNSNNIM